MAKLNTYTLLDTLGSTLQLIGIVPGDGTTFETNRISNAALVSFIEQYAGADGKEVALRKGSTAIEWQYVGDSAWTTLVTLADITGTKGDPGEQVQLQKSSTAIQWKYASSSTWTDLVQLSDIRGTNGTNGNTMYSVSGAPSSALGVNGDFANDVTNSMMYGPKTSGSWGAGVSYKGPKGDSGTGLKNRGTWVTGTTYNPGDYVFSTGSATASSMWILAGDADYVSTVLPKDDTTHWVEFVAPAGEDGENGKSVELRKGSTTIQWRLVGDTDWIDIVTLAELKGADGTNGNTVLTTTGAPASGTGVNGDYALDSAASMIYGPKAAGAWPAGVSLKGAAGVGAKWIFGASAPVAGTGVDGDMYLQSNGNIYGPKASGAWGASVGNIVGSTGAAGSKWYVGTTVPAAGTGANGDYYLQSNGDVYGPKASGAWGSIVFSLKGATGAGVPAGGTSGQMLAKSSGTDYATQWIDPPSGGGGSGDVTKAGNNAFTGTNSFSAKVTMTGGLDLSGVFNYGGGTMLYSGVSRKAGPSEGGTLSPTAGVSQQVITMAADVAAATIAFPNDSTLGIEITIYLEKAITSVTYNGGTMWGGSQAVTVIGAPATLRPGGHTFRLLLSETPSWYYIN